MMREVPLGERRIAVVGVVLEMIFLPVSGGVSHVCVIEVQSSRLGVMIGRLVQVGRAGQHAERQIDGTTGDCQDSTHRMESNRNPGIHAKFAN